MHLRSRLSVLVLLVTLLVITVSLNQVQSSPLPAGIVARINGQDLTREQYDTEVRLKEMKNAWAGRGDVQVNQALLLNQVIGDMLVLQAANETGFTVEEARVGVEIGGILGRLQLTAAEMEASLVEYNLTWVDLEQSVGNYLLVRRYLNEIVLDGTAPIERQVRIDAWLNERYTAAEMIFSPQFLDEINQTGVGVELIGLSG